MSQFFKTLAFTGRPVEACRGAGVGRGTVAGLRKSDPVFAARYDEALEEFAETLQREVVRRGRDGMDETVFGSMGPGAGTGAVGTRRVYSDRLLELELKRRDPSYRERMTVDANLTGGVLVVGPPAKTAE